MPTDVTFRDAGVRSSALRALNLVGGTAARIEYGEEGVTAPRCAYGEADGEAPAEASGEASADA